MDIKLLQSIFKAAAGEYGSVCSYTIVADAEDCDLIDVKLGDTLILFIDLETLDILVEDHSFYSSLASNGLVIKGPVISWNEFVNYLHLVLKDITINYEALLEDMRECEAVQGSGRVNTSEFLKYFMRWT